VKFFGVTGNDRTDGATDPVSVMEFWPGGGDAGTDQQSTMVCNTGQYLQ